MKSSARNVHKSISQRLKKYSSSPPSHSPLHFISTLYCSDFRFLGMHFRCFALVNVYTKSLFFWLHSNHRLHTHNIHTAQQWRGYRLFDSMYTLSPSTIVQLLAFQIKLKNLFSLPKRGRLVNNIGFSFSTCILYYAMLFMLQFFFSGSRISLEHDQLAVFGFSISFDHSSYSIIWEYDHMAPAF